MEQERISSNTDPATILNDIEGEANAIRDFANYINNEPVSEWRCDYLFQIDVRLDLIIEKVKQLKDYIK